MRLSIVIPCRNEQASIEDVIREFSRAARALTTDFEILVIDDCSGDRTPEILKTLQTELPELHVVRPAHNLGHGGAVRLGYERAAGEVVFQTDSDRQFDPGDLAALWARMGEADMVLGYRAKRRDPAVRRMISGFLSFLIALFYGRAVFDANCPFRLVRREALREAMEKISPQCPISNILLVLAMIEGRKILIQVPVRHFPRTTGKVSLRGMGLVKLCLRGVRDIAAFRRDGLRRSRDVK